MQSTVHTDTPIQVHTHFTHMYILYACRCTCACRIANSPRQKPILFKKNTVGNDMHVHMFGTLCGMAMKFHEAVVVQQKKH